MVLSLSYFQGGKVHWMIYGTEFDLFGIHKGYFITLTKGTLFLFLTVATFRFLSISILPDMPVS